MNKENKEKNMDDRRTEANNFIVRLAIKIFPLLVISLVIKDFIVHDEVVSLSNLADFIFKNIFIGFIISVILAALYWVQNEKNRKRGR